MLGSKAETLRNVSEHLTTAHVLPQFDFTVAEWAQAPSDILDAICSELGDAPWIVRSSAAGEDSAEQSMAGAFLSVGNIQDRVALQLAIEDVVASYERQNGGDQILVQPFVSVRMSGVAFSCDPATAEPYFIINYHQGDDTASVTGGNAQNICAHYLWQGECAEGLDPEIRKVADLLKELQVMTQCSALDIEFAMVDDGLPVLLQARPLIVKADKKGAAEDIHPDLSVGEALDHIEAKLNATLRPHPYLCGETTIFGIMPDWNPAEIIGVRPRPLSLSLYRNLVTDSIWAYQRHNYGYRNLRSFPLLTDFHGLPYVDVRVSFNSFIPGDLDEDLAGRLVNYYLESLKNTPSLHDKVEFEIVLSCYAFDLDVRLEALPDIFSNEDRRKIKASLLRLTNNILDQDQGLLVKDARKIETLQARQRTVMGANMDRVSRLYWLLEDCKRYGTLPFAGLARAGFVAVQILRSLVTIGILSQEEYDRFLSSVDNVSSSMVQEFAQLPREAFLNKYGHLRPGTYDILSPRYDETPDAYFDWDRRDTIETEPQERFSLTLSQMRDIQKLLDAHGVKTSVVGLFDFIEAGIRWREYAKFVFTRSLSDSLLVIRELGECHSFAVDDMSFVDVECLYRLYGGCDSVKDVLGESIQQGKRKYALTSKLVLPPLIDSAEQVRSFAQPPQMPNYITQGRVSGVPQSLRGYQDIGDGILLMPSADPGFDWIFSHPIKGFITAFGGANSHMAIRANELGIPAVIGVGLPTFEKLGKAKWVDVDCQGKSLRMC